MSNQPNNSNMPTVTMVASNTRANATIPSNTFVPVDAPHNLIVYNSSAVPVLFYTGSSLSAPAAPAWPTSNGNTVNATLVPPNTTVLVSVFSEHDTMYAQSQNAGTNLLFVQLANGF